VKKIVAAEWWLAVHSWRGWLACGLTLVVYALTMYVWQPPGTPTAIAHYFNAITAVLAFFGAYAQALWPVVLPLLAVLPIGDTLAVDRRHGRDAIIITRVGWRRYVWGKAWASALVSSAAVLTAAVVATALAWWWYPHHLPRLLGWTFPAEVSHRVLISGVFGNAYWPTFLPHAFWSSPGVYLGLVALVALWAVAALASLAVTAAIWLRPPVLVLAAPVAVFWLGDLVANVIPGGLGGSPSVFAGAYIAWPLPPAAWGVLLAYWAVPAAATAAILWAVQARRQWPQGSVGR